jgi:hypothetical protein
MPGLRRPSLLSTKRCALYVATPSVVSGVNLTFVMTASKLRFG